MGLFDHLWGRSSPRSRPDTGSRSHRSVTLWVERLEDRLAPDATGVLAGGVLTITGRPVAYDVIHLQQDPTTNQIVLLDNGVEAGRFSSPAVTSITVNSAAHFNVVQVDANVTQPATIQGGPGTNFLFAGGGPTTLIGGPGTNRLVGGAGNDTLDGSLGGTNTYFGDGGSNILIGAPASNRQLRGTLVDGNAASIAGVSHDFFFGALNTDTIAANFDPSQDFDFRSATAPSLNLQSQFLGLTPAPDTTIDAAQVGGLLARAAAATSSDDGIVAIVDRSGRILGVRVEGNVDPAITSNPEKLVFAIDGAVALARTGAFFASDNTPLTSRTIEFISQTTVTQREVQSDPSVSDPNSTFRGPGFVAPIGTGGHFPPGVANTPQVDLFQIEGTNRDTTFHLGLSNRADGADRFFLPQRFNIDPTTYSPLIPQRDFLAPPDSYGLASGLEPDALPRGIGTLPGGLPIYRNGILVGGIGVFFPGKTGFADEENAHLQGTSFDANRPDRSLEAEFDAFAAEGGSPGFGFPIGTLGNTPPVPEISPYGAGRIDLVGITLPIFGPEGLNGPQILVDNAQHLGIGQGDPNSHAVLTNLPTSMFPGGTFGGRPGELNAPLLQPDATVNQLVTTTPPSGGSVAINTSTVTPPTTANPAGTFVPTTVFLPTTFAPGNLLSGTEVPQGWIVTPHSSLDGKITAADVVNIIAHGVQQATVTRAAIRLPMDTPTSMVLAVCDPNGNILGLFRMPDSTIFSIDVAVAKSRNVAYYADPNQLQPIDQLPGIPAGTAFTNRTFRYLAEPFYPEGINGAPPGPFSLLNVPGSDQFTGLNTAPPQPASAYFNTVLGHDAFFPQTNFHDPFNIQNQDGIVFFPGSVPLYRGTSALIGGFGVSGDGVDQDDVVTFAGKQLGLNTPTDDGFDTPPSVPRIDQFFVNGVRPPYQKFNRQPLEFGPPAPLAPVQ